MNLQTIAATPEIDLAALAEPAAVLVNDIALETLPREVIQSRPPGSRRSNAVEPWLGGFLNCPRPGQFRRVGHDN